mgnify:CR=1 FL=1
MEELCESLKKCRMSDCGWKWSNIAEASRKPILYSMMIEDFNDLSQQYNTSSEYTFNMNQEFETATQHDIEQLLVYIQSNNCEDILYEMIQTMYPNLYVERRILIGMVDYYMECLYTAVY